MPALPFRLAFETLGVSPWGSMVAHPPAPHTLPEKDSLGTGHQKVQGKAIRIPGLRGQSTVFGRDCPGRPGSLLFVGNEAQGPVSIVAPPGVGAWGVTGPLGGCFSRT